MVGWPMTCHRKGWKTGAIHITYTCIILYIYILYIDDGNTLLDIIGIYDDDILSISYDGTI